MSDDQLTREDIARMWKRGQHDAIEQARRDGRLNGIQGIDDLGVPKQGPLTLEHVRALYRDRRYADIEQARRDGRLGELLSGVPTPDVSEQPKSVTP